MSKLITKSKPWVVVICVLAFTLSLSSAAFAGWHRDRWGWFGLGVAASALTVGSVVASLPYGYTTVEVGGSPYYYYDNVYYRSGSGGYVVVDAPVATVFRETPSGYAPVVINGITYYVNNGVYYVYTSYGYQIVQPPVTVAQPLVATFTPVKPVTTDSNNAFTINVPNKHGGFTPVKLIKHNNGYVGPQGEYYERPTVDQLKALYGE
jgi:hypothetical protein